MSNWLKTLPSELPILLGLSFILVVIPTIWTIFIRISGELAPETQSSEATRRRIEIRFIPPGRNN